MWSISTSTGFWLCVLGFSLLALEARSIAGLIGRRRKRLANLKAGIPPLGEPPKIAESIESMAVRMIAKARAEGIQRQATKVLCLISIAGLIYSYGYQRRDAEFHQSRYHYTDVVVKARYAANHFLLQPARMQSWDAITCLPNDWEQGQKMVYLDFQWSADGKCKDVGIGGAYQFYLDSSGNRIIYEQEISQNGR